MEKITMDDVQVELERINAGLEIVLDELNEDLSAVQKRERSNDDCTVMAVSVYQRTSAVYAPTLDLIHAAVSDLKRRVDKVAE